MDSNEKESLENSETSKKNFSLSGEKFGQNSKPVFNLRRPETLNLSLEYGSTSKALKNGKKSLSYDLWVNENVAKANENGGKKMDLAGRVSFRLVLILFF